MVDWCYIFSILALGVYPCSPDIYNVGAKTNYSMHLRTNVPGGDARPGTMALAP